MTRRNPRALLGVLLAVALSGPVLLAGGCTSKKTTTTAETVEYPEGSTLPRLRGIAPHPEGSPARVDGRPLIGRG